MSDEKLNDEAVGIAAKIAGLRHDQIETAILEYRNATEELNEDAEPEWRAYLHMGPYHMYEADSTSIVLQIEEFKQRNEGWKQDRTYILRGRTCSDVTPYKSWSEARLAELSALAKVKLVALSSPEEG